MADQQTNNPITQCAADAEPSYKFNGREVRISAHCNHSNPKVQALLNSCQAVAPTAGQAAGGFLLGVMAAGGFGGFIGALTPVVCRLGKSEPEAPSRT